MPKIVDFNRDKIMQDKTQDTLKAQLRFLNFLLTDGQRTDAIDSDHDNELIAAAEELSVAHSNYRDACFATDNALAEVVRRQKHYAKLING